MALRDNAWLHQSTLPEKCRLKTIAESFFNHVHPLRNLGFIHKPSFIKAIDQNTTVAEYGEAVVYLVCALGARYMPVPKFRGNISMSDPLDEELNVWYDQLPDFLAFNDINLYIHKEQHTLGPYFFLHLAYHACVFDLTRVTLPGYSFPLSGAFFHVPEDFTLKYRHEAWYHACCVSKLLETGLECGTETLDDHFTSTAAFESTKIQVIYLTTMANGSSRLYNEGIANINTNLRVLTVTHPYPDMPNVYLSALVPFLHRFGFSDIATYWQPFQNTVLLAPSQSVEDNSEVVGPIETAFLNQIATFRLARREITDEERRTGTCTPWSFSSAPPSPRPERSRLAQTLGPPSQPFDESGLHMLALAGQSQSEAVTSQLLPIMMPEPASTADATQGLSLDQEQYFRMAEEISDYMTWDIALASQFDFPMEDFFSTPGHME
ncbi:hypothetical protein BHE90_001437 [Fusarium euwallaceae]|uniref:Xylanolytic transcriptional activator regulatory domain-containing protein n=1 Tax=Fusarium euwallaceae TaxID=1147111 RepID=A0A430M7U7_9HYPO|nr:hypothetical protein BHE90_001437 [Fusarium euwallaceae]